jgi:putative DNA primase/helicase
MVLHTLHGLHTVFKDKAMTNDQKRTIRKIARIRDKATDKFLEVIEFPISETEIKTLELPPSVVNEPGAFEKQLRDAGAILPKGDQDLKDLLSAVAKSDAPEERVYEARTGWTEDGKPFVLVDGVIGDTTSKIIGVNRAHSVNDRSGRLSKSGSWKAWRDTVAEPARLSTILMFGVCVALAAPLLAIVNRPSFTICLFGKTRIGKSIATLLGASIIGIARIDDLITWNITDARLEERISEFNDALFPIDDLSIMRGRKKDKYLRVRDLAYGISQGFATARHSSFTAAHGGVHGSWRTIALTSNEKSIRDLARDVKLERQHGEALRLIDQPAVFDGLDHIFDRLPDNLDTSNFQDWKKDTFKKIADGCEKNHGRPFEKYINALIADKAKLERYVQARIAFFVEHVCDEYDGDVTRDVAEKFGLIYAAGRLGIRCELLPWDKTELLDALSNCYFGARDLLPDDGVAVRQGILALRTKLHQMPRITDEAVAETDYDDVDGYRERRKKVNRYLIKRDAFNSIFVSGTQRSLVIQRLIQMQRVTLASPKGSTGASSPEPQGQFMWPDGKRRRSFEIRWPRKSQEGA